MAISGTGTGINELTALAGTAELVPVKQRGYYVAGLIITMLPFIPSVLYAQLIASTSSEGWRSISYVTGGWAFIGLIMTFCFYHPPPPRRARVANGGAAGEQEQGDRRNKREILGDMDFIGGVLSMLGLVAVEVGLLAGGYQVWFLFEADGRTKGN